MADLVLPAATGGTTADVYQDKLYAAVLALDSAGIRHGVLDSRDELGSDALVADVLVPVLRRIGEMWEIGELDVQHEHHASQIIRSVIGELRRQGGEPLHGKIVLACPPGEQHDLPIHLFGVMLRGRRWQPIVLGADTPWAALGPAIRASRANACVLAGTRPGLVQISSGPVRELARTTTVFLAGEAATGPPINDVINLSSNWYDAADQVSAVTLKQLSATVARNQ